MGCSPTALRFIVGEYAGILAEHGDALAKAELVLPTGEYFPDEFQRDADSLARLLERTTSYTPLADDLVVRLGLVESEPDHGGGGCGGGSCGGGAAARVDGVLDEGDGYRVLLHVGDTGSPARLVGSLARGVGAVVACEAGEPLTQPPGEDTGARSEVWAAATGFGVLLLGASHVYAKSCGGVSVHRGTALDTDALAVLLALFCAVRGIKPALAEPHLGPTQREAFDEARRLVGDNAELVRKLRESPELLEDGVFELERPKGLLARLFGGGGAAPPPRAPERAAKPVSAEERRRLEEARALVDEAFGDTSSPSR